MEWRKYQRDVVGIAAYMDMFVVEDRYLKYERRGKREEREEREGREKIKKKGNRVLICFGFLGVFWRYDDP